MVLGVVGLEVAAGASPAPDRAPYRGSRLEADALEQGFATIEVAHLDSGYAVAEQRDGRYFLSWVHSDGRRLERRQRLGPWRADGLERIRGVQADGEGGTEILFATREEAPDEVVHRVSVHGFEGERMTTLFERRFTLPKTRVDRSDVRYGDAEPRWEVKETQDGLELVWFRGPRVLRVPRGEEVATFTIGAETAVYRWNGQTLAEVASASYRDFLPRLEISEADGRQGDRSLDVARAVDARPETAWILPKPEAGMEASITVQLPRTETIRMVRIVPGCAEDPDSWARHAEIRSFQIDLGGALELELDRAHPEAVPPGVKAWGEFPLFTTHGRQVVVFLEPPRRAGWARFTPLRPRRTGRGTAPACLAELSLH